MAQAGGQQPSEQDAAAQLQRLSLDLQGAQQQHHDVALADLSADQQAKLKEMMQSLQEAKVENKYQPDEFEALRYLKVAHPLCTKWKPAMTLNHKRHVASLLRHIRSTLARRLPRTRPW